MNITEDIKRQILSRTDIVEIIGEAIDLRRKGRSFVGLCPFHNDTHPSMNVNPDLGIYKCFSCGAGGDVISFLINYHRLSYLESMQLLAKRGGIVIPDDYYEKKDKGQVSKIELALNVLSAAAVFFQRILETPLGSTARSFYTKRGFNDSLIKEFMLGYSPDSWDSTINELKKQGFTESALDDAGLIVRNESNSSYYDRFRNRAMFPIQDYLGKVIAFGARQLNPEDKMGKYINSPQTIVYDKSQTLYGLFQAKNEIRSRKFAILVEGYADVISMHSAGFKNTVASSGTALTKEQLDLLYRYCKKIYIAYDSDSAGITAAERALELAKEKGFEIMIVCLPDGEDPDSIIQKHGNKLMNTYLDHAMPFLQFKIDLLEKSGTMATPSGKSDAVRQIIRIISSIPDKLQHDEYIRQLSSLMQISESQLKEIYKEKLIREKKSQQKSTQKIVNDNNESKSENSSSIKQNSKSINTKDKSIDLLNEEMVLLRIALTDSSAHNLLKDRFEFVKDKFISDEGKRLMALVLSQESEMLLNTLLHNDKITESDKNYLTFLSMSEEHPSVQWERFRNNMPVNDLIRLIQDLLYRLEQINIDTIKDKIRIQQLNAPVETQLELVKKIKELDENLIKLKKFYEIQ
ncbi:MAG: DNA primase [Ignavibacteriae bacterium]|nr:DNA primase [Ignavibacteriota bacterium]